MAHQFVGYAVFLPLVGFLVNGLIGRKLARPGGKSESLIGFIGSAAVGIGFVIAAATFLEMLGNPSDQRSYVVYLFN
jgi:NADH:ubiquinone oxidoreductase subunit 5 (subunit L)/multisubunit Na+/H+ antiporter MnhA subunit